VTHIAGEITISAPIDLVFDTVADERNEPSYNPRIARAELATEGPLGPGTRFSVRPKGAGGTGEMTVEIVEYDRPRRLHNVIRSSSMLVDGTLSFEETAGGTRFSWDWQMTLLGPFRVLTPVLALVGPAWERRNWRSLKNHLEGGPSERIGGPATPSSARRLLGLRATPGRLALQVFRVPVRLYDHGWGRVLDHVFLRLVHVGRRTGREHSTVAMVLAYDPGRRSAVICSAWGAHTDWVRNLRAGPAARVDIGRDSFVPAHRFLTEEEGVAVGKEFRRRHPRRLRLMSRVLGWGGLESDEALRVFVASRPFVELAPADQSRRISRERREGWTRRSDEQRRKEPS
jgi:deazaflavin-dependent oxidoreductase (nitroreductase family)